MLPHASGPHNIFLGELQDAGETGTAALPLIVAHSLLSKHGGSLPQRLLRIFPRQATLSYAALLLFSSCSISEIDYRGYQWGYHPAPGHPRDCPLLLVSAFRSEKSAERSCRRGFVIGNDVRSWDEEGVVSAFTTRVYGLDVLGWNGLRPSLQWRRCGLGTCVTHVWAFQGVAPGLVVVDGFAFAFLMSS